MATPEVGPKNKREAGKVVKRKWFLLFLLSLAPALHPSVSAEDSFSLPVKEAVVYPGGMAFLVHEGEVFLENGECTLDFLPQALKGSLRLYSPTSGITVEQVTAFRDRTEKESAVQNRGEFFRENIGKPIQLLTEEEFVTGKLKGFIDPDLLVVTVLHDSGLTSDQVYPLSQITTYYFLEPVNLHKKTEEEKGKLRVRLHGAVTPACSLGLSYLQTGLTWYPEYILDLHSEYGAELLFSGVVTNDLIDLENITLYLAEEGPAFTRELSPLVIFDRQEETLARAVLTSRGVVPEADTGFYYGVQDQSLPSLLVYSVSGVSLGKGERAVFPLFRGVVRVEPVYCLEISHPGYGRELPEIPVHKGYRIFNDSARLFWQEGQVLITRDNIPLGLRRLPYIPPGSSGEIIVQTDSSIRAKVSEEEFERIQRSLVFQEQTYSLVKVRGEITLKNHKEEAVNVVVSQLLSGEVTAAGDGGKITRKAPFYHSPNPQTEITWEVAIPAGAERKLTYVYQTYILPTR